MTSLRGRAAALLAAAALIAPAPLPAAPLPTPKPELVSEQPSPPAPPATSASIAAPVPVDDVAVAAIRAAVSSLDLNDLTGAMAAVERRSALEKDIVTWLAIRRQVTGVTPEMVTDFMKRKPHWPTPAIMRTRVEQMLVRGRLEPRVLVSAFGSGAPLTEEGTLALARALVALNRKPAATKVLGPWWAKAMLSPERDRAVLAEFGDVLAREHHKARFDMLMYADRVDQAETLGAKLGSDYVGLAAARKAVLRGTKTAARMLEKVTGEARADPLHAFTLAELHRRADRNEAAAEVLLTVDAKKTAEHGDAWWVERRIISRGLLEAGDARRAYALASGHRGGDAETVAEAHFHAGWYALRFLADPALARPHFEALQAAVTMPISRSRAAYWLGRTDEAAGRIEDARQHYTVAASDEATFYGQLARVKLNQTSLDMPKPPEPTDTDRAAFRDNDMARALVTLIKAGDSEDGVPLQVELARQLPSGGQVVILADYLERLGHHRAALQVGKIAADRNLGTEQLAFPLNAIPEAGRTDTLVETAMVYSIARQESAFDPGAVSHAGALGLLQLLPGTAAETARTLGLAYSQPRLTADAEYNAKLGSAHLRELVDEFDGSYVLTFAAYNAGRRRAYQWIERFGDPRDPKVDPIDWIEQIPFYETRNYVQRVTENIQVYRERLSDAKLGIAEDLTRGGS